MKDRCYIESANDKECLRAVEVEGLLRFFLLRKLYIIKNDIRLSKQLQEFLSQ